jgi:hypothetical protein
MRAFTASLTKCKNVGTKEQSGTTNVSSPERALEGWVLTDLRSLIADSMNQRTESRSLLTDTLPEFAGELQRLLADAGEPELTAEVPGLRIFDRCRCGDDFCATFYTQSKPKDGFGPGHRNVRLMTEEAMLILDVVDGEIACVEVLGRADVREKFGCGPSLTYTGYLSFAYSALAAMRTGCRGPQSSHASNHSTPLMVHMSPP